MLGPIRASVYAQFLFIIVLLCHIARWPHSQAGVRKVSSSISCFSCSTRNISDDRCSDPFNPAMSKYSENCKVPKQNHIGIFPARFCVKVIGKEVKTGEFLMIRSCSLENMDNQCGNFKFDEKLYKGCILTCDYDGCNQAPSRTQWLTIVLSIGWSVLLCIVFS